LFSSSDCGLTGADAIKAKHFPQAELFCVEAASAREDLSKYELNDPLVHIFCFFFFFSFPFL
jgi:hypothetical protein